MNTVLYHNTSTLSIDSNIPTHCQCHHPVVLMEAVPSLLESSEELPAGVLTFEASGSGEAPGDRVKSDTREEKILGDNEDVRKRNQQSRKWDWCGA